MPTFELPVRSHRFFPADAPPGQTARTVSVNTNETALPLTATTPDLLQAVAQAV